MSIGMDMGMGMCTRIGVDIGLGMYVGISMAMGMGMVQPQARTAALMVCSLF